MRGCDAVVHFAAESHVDRSIYEPAPAIQTNVTGTFILLQVARKLGSSGSFTSRPMKSMATSPPAPSRRIRRCTEQPVFGLEGRLGPAGAFLCAHLRISRPDHSLVQ